MATQNAVHPREPIFEANEDFSSLAANRKGAPTPFLQLASAPNTPWIGKVENGAGLGSSDCQIIGCKGQHLAHFLKHREVLNC